MAVKLLALFVIILFVDVNCKVYKQPLTESMGQEVIEMASPDKELPAELEEEPSAESFEGRSTSTTIEAATKNVPVKGSSSRRVNNSMKDEEKRIEKELAELYRDPDYKESGENNITDGRKAALGNPESPFELEDKSPGGVAKFRTKSDHLQSKNTSQTTTLEPRITNLTLDAEDLEKPVSSAPRTTTISLCLLPVIVMF